MAEVKTRQPAVRPEIAAARGVALRSTPIANDSSAAPRQILAAAATSVPTTNLLQEMLGYQCDLFERTILFWDTLRQRADNMIAHERAGKPPLLDFDYEMQIDARRFERPA